VSDREAETCGWLEFVWAVMAEEVGSLTLLVIKTLEVLLDELGGLAPKLAELVLLVPERVVLKDDGVVYVNEPDMLSADTEVATSVSDAGPEDTVEMENAEMLLLLLSVPITLVA